MQMLDELTPILAGVEIKDTGGIPESVVLTSNLYTPNGVEFDVATVKRFDTAPIIGVNANAFGVSSNHWYVYGADPPDALTAMVEFMPCVTD